MAPGCSAVLQIAGELGQAEVELARLKAEDPALVEAVMGLHPMSRLNPGLYKGRPRISFMLK